MEAFKVYLPSNACTDLYPNNSPSNYRTQFDKAIDLDGDWEVGVESVMYSPFLDDKLMKSVIEVTTTTRLGQYVNRLYSHEYHLNSDDEWPGFDGVMPENYETDKRKVTSILSTLNGMVSLILKESIVSSIPLFQFRLNESGQVEYFCSDSSFTLLITANLAKVLGFDYETVLPSNQHFTAKYKRKISDLPLTKADYCLKYFNSTVQEEVFRVFLDHTDFQGNNSVEEKEKKFIEMWQRKVESLSNMSCRFYKHQLIVANHGKKAIILSPHLSRTFDLHSYPIFGKENERWSGGGAIYDRIATNDVWYVDIYSTKMEMSFIDREFTITADVYPWQYKTKEKVLMYLNKTMTHEIQNALGEDYKVRDHLFDFNLDLLYICHLKLGRRVHVKAMSDNLLSMLALPSFPWQEGTEVKGTKQMSHVFNRSRQLYLLSDVVQTTKHGNNAVTILQDFLHYADKDKPIVRRSFFPINYVRLRKTHLDNILLRLVDEQFDDVKIRDSKTLVTLYFRKVQ